MTVVVGGRVVVEVNGAEDVVGVTGVCVVVVDGACVGVVGVDVAEELSVGTVTGVVAEASVVDVA